MYPTSRFCGYPFANAPGLQCFNRFAIVANTNYPTPVKMSQVEFRQENVISG
jgi:hypothetical protein